MNNQNIEQFITASGALGEAVGILVKGLQNGGLNRREALDTARDIIISIFLSPNPDTEEVI